jgi:uncharacterized protein YcnI
MLHVPRVLWRSAVAVAAVGVAVFGMAAPASAHVTVSSASAVQGGYAKVTFRVPNEKSDADTVKLEVVLPADQPIASVSTKPVQGWTVAAEKAKLPTPIKTDDGELTEAVSKITWTATGDAAIKAGQFQEFDVSLGPLPKNAGQIVFKALQTYSTGEIVRWIEVPSGGSEPANPAPVLKLAKADTTDTGADGGTAPAAEKIEEDSNALPIGLGIAGLVLGALGLGVALVAFRRSAARP